MAVIVWTSEPAGVYRVLRHEWTRPGYGSGEPWDVPVTRRTFELFENGTSVGTWATLALAKDSAAWRGGEGPLSYRDDRRPRFIPRRRTSVRAEPARTPVRTPPGRSMADLFK